MANDLRYAILEELTKLRCPYCGHDKYGYVECGYKENKTYDKMYWCDRCKKEWRVKNGNGI